MSRRLPLGFRVLFLSGLSGLSGLTGSVLAQEKPSLSFDDWVLTLETGKSIRLALPDFVARTLDTRAEAAELSQVIQSDIEFASVVGVLNEKLYPGISSDDALRMDYRAWKAVGADLVVTGEVSREKGALRVEVRMHAVDESVTAFATEYRGPGDQARRLAHRIADDLLAKLGAMGVAQTKIAFASERERDDSHRRAIFRMDYDGARPDRLTAGFLDLSPRWSPDGAALLYVSFGTRYSPPTLEVRSNTTRRTLHATERMVFPGSWSPDGTRIAFSSTHDGNAEIYVVDADGGALRRLTDHPGIDVSPTWSPTGRELAFTSDRSGSPQIYTMDQDGLNVSRISTAGSYNAEPAWSPSKEFSEIAWASRIEGAVFDIVVLDLLTKRIRQLTSRRGLNESPSWAPNGRHLVFSSTRTGDPQIFTINRDGTNLRQLTFEGRNTTPSWSWSREEKD
jgi:TolB protein